MHRTAIASLDGWISSREQRWRDVTRALGPIAWRGDRFYGGLAAARWLVGDAYERLDRLDSAAAYFELLVRPTRMHWEELELRGFTASMAHVRLARLYTRMGHRDRARQHWQAFLDNVTDPDPEVLRFVDEARLAVAGKP